MKIKIPFIDRSRMTMKEQIVNPLSIEEALELGKESIIPITDYWEYDPNHSGLNKLPFGFRIPEGIVTLAEKERKKGRYGVYRDIVPSCGSSAAPYFADMITEPMEKFMEKFYPDGRAKVNFL